MKLRFAALTVFVSFAAFAADDVGAIWKRDCKSCHGEVGKAETANGKKYKIEDMSSAAWQSEWTDEKIAKVVNEGIKDTKMKAFKGKLTDEEIASLTKHIRTFKK